MNISYITPKKGFVITKAPKEEERQTTSGIILKENTDDFLITSEVVSSASEQFAVGQSVVIPLFEAQGFRDQGESYLFIHEDRILGVYGGE